MNKSNDKVANYKYHEHVWRSRDQTKMAAPMYCILMQVGALFFSLNCVSNGNVKLFWLLICCEVILKYEYIIARSINDDYAQNLRRCLGKFVKSRDKSKMAAPSGTTSGGGLSVCFHL